MPEGLDKHILRMFSLLFSVQQLCGTLTSVPVQKMSVTQHRLKQHYKLSVGIDRFSLTSLDGYSTIDQRDKDCKYKTPDGSVDLTEREPLKVQADLLWSQEGLGHRG